MTPIELSIVPKEHFEDNLDKFINNEAMADDVDKHKPYREKPLRVNVIDQAPISESSETLKCQTRRKFI